MERVTILVTGAGGYIGSVATYLLLQKGYKVVGLDNFSRGYREPLELFKSKYSDTFSYYEIDLLDNLDDIFEKEKFDAVLHYAAFCNVNESMEFPEKYFTNNVSGTQNLLSTMFKYNVNKIVFSSTCAVYAPAQYMPIDTKHPTGPESPYGESKLIMEQMMKWYSKTKNLKYLILRYFNVCGASDDGIIGDSKKPSSLLVQNAVRGALEIEPFHLTCPKVDTPDGTPIRDYIHVVDLNEAHLLGLEYVLNGKESALVNLGTGTGNSVLEIVETVQKITGKKFDVQEGEKRKGEATKVIADVSEAQKVLGWKPKRTIEDSINSLITWYTSHPNGWSK